MIRLSVGLENIDDLKLDLKEAFSKIPKEVFEKTRKHYLNQQNAKGGWGYRSSKSVTASMTAAGLSSLSLCGEQLENSLEVTRGPRFIGQYQTNTKIQKSMKYDERPQRKTALESSKGF